MTAFTHVETSGTWILAATILGSSMAFTDGTVVNVALPALQTSFNATASNLQWVVEAYALFLAALLLVGGSLGDLYGRRRIFLAGVVLFALASAWCGLAPTIQQLIAARSIQGIGAALLVPGSLALISASFPPEQQGHAIGTWSGFTAITAVAGPVLGGWLVQHASWRAVFFLNLPIAVAVLTIFHTFNASLDHRLAALNLTPATRESVDRQRSKLAAIETANPQAQAAIGNAFIAGYDRVILVGVALCLAAALSAAAVIRPLTSSEKPVSP